MAPLLRCKVSRRIFVLCDCARLVGCCCRRKCIPQSVVTVILTTSRGEAPSDDDDDDDDDHAGRASSSGGGRRRLAGTMAATHLPMHPLSERLEHQPRQDVFFVLVIPDRLHRLRRCRPPAKTPLPKLAERDLQEIVPVLPRFRVGVGIVFHHDAAAIVALPFLPSNEQHANVDCGHRRRRGRRTPRHRRRRRPHCRRGNRAEEDPVCHAEVGVTQAASGVDAPPIRRTSPPPSPPQSPLPPPTRYCRESSPLPRQSGPSRPTVGAEVLLEHPLQRHRHQLLRRQWGPQRNSNGNTPRRRWRSWRWEERRRTMTPMAIAVTVPVLVERRRRSR